MRISWLEPDVIRLARGALMSHRADWDDHFTPRFEPPPAPRGVPEGDWPQIAEHVARAERVSYVVREHGLPGALAAFAGSSHAVEVATVIAAAVEVEAVSLELLESLLACEVDEWIAYGQFLDLLINRQGAAPDRVLAAYQRFCDALVGTHSEQPLWEDRVGAARDGLASVYVSCGRHDEGDELFRARHQEDGDDLVVALSASRAFLAAGALGRAIEWLGMGADRARDLGRPEMEARLRDKQAVLRRRMS